MGKNVILHLSKHNAKCGVVNTNPKTGITDDPRAAEGQILKAMKFRDYNPEEDSVESDPDVRLAKKKVSTGPLFSINCGIDATGIVRVGDPVYVLH